MIHAHTQGLLTQEIPLIRSGNFGKSMELFNMSSAIGIVSHIARMIDDPYLRFTVTHIVGNPEDGQLGFYIHSRRPPHAFLVKITSASLSEIPPVAHNVYRDINIECYIAAEDVAVYPIGMYPGCDIFKHFIDVGRAVRLHEFAESSTHTMIREYMFSCTKIEEFKKEHPEFYEGF